MFRGDLLIDGYNLLHAAGLAQRNYGPGEFERTRQRLIKLLAGQLAPRERRRTTVVFDAPVQSLGPSPPAILHGIQVRFAGGDGDADAVIEQLIQQNSAPKRLHVISSDHRLQRAARRRRAKFFDSEEFLARLAARPTPEERAASAEPPEKREGLSAPGQVEAWMKAFADVEPMLSSDQYATRESPTAKPTEKEITSTEDPVQDAETDEVESAPDEVTFWERRIAELWAQTDEGPQ